MKCIKEKRLNELNDRYLNDEISDKELVHEFLHIFPHVKVDRENVLCEAINDEPLTLDDINGEFIGDLAMAGLEDYAITDFDNPGCTLDKVHINHQNKQLECEFVDNPVYKKRMLRQ